MQLDDDYSEFGYKIDSNYKYVTHAETKNLDIVLSLMLEYYKNIPCLSLAMSQGGDYIGGKNSATFTSQNRKRKAMNTFICSTSRRFQFIGRVNEDVNTYTHIQNTGGLFLSFIYFSIEQGTTQANSGGMSEMYLDSGTYIKSFYTVMYQPSSVKVKRMLSHSHERLHHAIDWDCTVPCIISEEWKK